MLFTSVRYLVFLTIIALLYYVIPRKFRLALLIASSYYFYASWDLFSVVWLLVITGISYFGGKELAKVQDPRARKRITLFSAGSIILILIVFKFSKAAPTGISFYTFMTLSYLFDVASEKTTPASRLSEYALSVSFFPHLLQGPIDRPSDLLYQIRERLGSDTSCTGSFEYDSFCHGLTMILFGVFKKVVIADRLAMLVNPVFDHVTEHTGQAFWVASIFYTFQIYCDFSGYTDIALGSAELLGFKLTENFKRPYLATSVADFWRRWHISLSRWFRDYIYIPLGGNRCSEARWAMNVIIVFLVSGFWHGASWTFILWGFFHGLFQVIGKYKIRLSARIFREETLALRCFRTVVTFLIVNFLWILFRARSLSDLAVICARFFKLAPGFSIYNLGMGKEDVVFSILLIVFVIVTDVVSETIGGYTLLKKLPVVVRRGLYMACVFVILLFGIYGSLSADSFIYFTF